MKLSRCIFCNKIILNKDGLQILDKNICTDCEKKLLTLKVGSPQYISHLQRIKNIWSNY